MPYNICLLFLHISTNFEDFAGIVKSRRVRRASRLPTVSANRWNDDGACHVPSMSVTEHPICSSRCTTSTPSSTRINTHKHHWETMERLSGHGTSQTSWCHNIFCFPWVQVSNLSSLQWSVPVSFHMPISFLFDYVRVCWCHWRCTCLLRQCRT